MAPGWAHVVVQERTLHARLHAHPCTRRMYGPVGFVRNAWRCVCVFVWLNLVQSQTLANTLAHTHSCRPTSCSTTLVNNWKHRIAATIGCAQIGGADFVAIATTATTTTTTLNKHTVSPVFAADHVWPSASASAACYANGCVCVCSPFANGWCGGVSVHTIPSSASSFHIRNEAGCWYA